jgi:hypothetical protein
VIAPLDFILSRVALAAKALKEVLAKLTTNNPNKIILFIFINSSKCMVTGKIGAKSSFLT